MDESALTGESVPVAKQPMLHNLDQADEEHDANDNALFAGTMLVAGQGLAQITRTGANTHIGAIGASLSGEMERTPLGNNRSPCDRSERYRGRILLAGRGRLRRHARRLDCGRPGRTYGCHLLAAEEFPMVLAVFLAIGSWRLARHQVLVRRAAVVETLGAVTMLCVDKTGTLTENRMTVGTTWSKETCWGPTWMAHPER